MENPPKYISWVLFLLSFLILYYTSYPSIGWWDSGIYPISAFNLSIPSPGGSIVYILLGKFFTIIFFFLPAIKAITLVSIVSTGLASVLVYYSLLEILSVLKKSSGTNIRLVSFLTALSLPFLFSVWAEANVSRVYALGLFLTAVILYSTVKIWFSGDEQVKQKYFFLIVFVMAIDYSAHRLNLPFVPIIIILLFLPLRKNLLSIKFWAVIIILLITGLSVHLFLLIRSIQNTPVRMDDVRSIKDLLAWITMKRYGQSNLSMIFQRQAPFWDYQVNFMYLRYFNWNFLLTQGIGIFHSSAFLNYIPFLLGAAGFIYSLVKRIKVWLLLFLPFLFYSFGLIIYSNINFGFHNIREIDRLFLPSFMIFLLWIGIGLFISCEALSYLLKRYKVNTKLIFFTPLIIGFIALPLNIIITNWKACDKSEYHFPADFAFNALSSCNKNAVLFTNGDNDTFPLLYMQNIEGYRTDVSVVNLSLLNTDFYVKELMESKNGFNIDSALLSPEEFAPSLLKQPEKIILPFKDDLTAGNSGLDTLSTEFTGRKMGSYSVIMPQDKILLSFLRRNIWKRAVYFCVTVAEDNLIGLGKYLNLEGVVSKLVPVKDEKITPVKLETNLMYTYRYGVLNNKNVTIDKTTKNMFLNFRQAFYELESYYLSKGDTKKAGEVIRFMKVYLPDWRFAD